MTPTLVSPSTRAGAAAAPVATQRLVLGRHRRKPVEIMIGTHHLAIGSRSVALDDIDAVAYSSRTTHANLVQRRVRRHLWLGLAPRPVTLDLGTNAFGPQDDEREAAAFAALVRVLHDRVEPRLRRRRVAHLDAGGALQLGPLRLDADGVSIDGTAGERCWSWRAVPMAELRGDHVAVVDAGDDTRVHGCIDASIPDAVMLPELLWSASAALI